jgi:predicted secreted Zn-dependent protease
MDSRTAEDIKRHFEVVTSDVKRHADVVAEGLRSDIRTVAEGVAGLDEKFTLEFERVRAEMREQLGEVKSLVRGSYGDLDRRVQSLEKNRQP